jgi:hypothetical protein
MVWTSKAPYFVLFVYQHIGAYHWSNWAAIVMPDIRAVAEVDFEALSIIIQKGIDP